MPKKPGIRLIIALALFTLSCQAFDNLGLRVTRTPVENEPDTWPHSAFTQMILLDRESGVISPAGVVDLTNTVTLEAGDPEELPPGLLLPQQTVPVPEGRPVRIDTIHLSSALLYTITVSINDQLIRPEETADQEAGFPNRLVDLWVQTEQGLVQTSSVKPKWPTREKKLSLIWVGLTPGTYELKLRAEDIAGRSGNVITQRIEVQDSTP